MTCSLCGGEIPDRKKSFTCRDGNVIHAEMQDCITAAREQGRRAGLERAVEILWARVEREEYGHAKAAVTLNIEAIRAELAAR